MCVFVCALRLYPATPGWGVRCWRVCLGSGFVCAPPLLVGVCGVDVCAWARVSAAPRHSWLGCWGVCVLVCALRLYPATFSWRVRCACVCSGSVLGSAPPLLAGVLGCACLCAPSACTPPLLAGVCGVGVCASARVSAAPRHSWLGCVVCVCVLGLGFALRPATPGCGVEVCVFVCALRLYPAAPGWGVRCWGVCLGSGFGCAPPLLAGVCDVGVCESGCRLRPATPSWGVGVCMCLCVPSACTPPLLAGVCGVLVCVWARFLAPPRHSWLGCWGVHNCVRPPLVLRHSWLGCAVCVCVLGLGFWLRPATPGRGVVVCVCLCVRSACTPPLLAGLCGVGVCALARVSAAPRHSWLGCAVSACVLGLWFGLRPATLGRGARCGCVSLGSGFGCAPPLLAGVLGCVCACVCAPLVPRPSCLGCAVWVCVLGLGFRLRPATPGWGVGLLYVLVCALCLYPATPG